VYAVIEQVTQLKDKPGGELQIHGSLAPVMYGSRSSTCICDSGLTGYLARRPA
jgi:hypothetical protein